MNMSVLCSIPSVGSLYHSASDAFTAASALPPQALYARSVPAPACTSEQASPHPPAAVRPASPSISTRVMSPNVSASTATNTVDDVPRSPTANRRASIALPSSMLTVSSYPAR